MQYMGGQTVEPHAKIALHKTHTAFAQRKKNSHILNMAWQPGKISRTDPAKSARSKPVTLHKKRIPKYGLTAWQNKQDRSCKKCKKKARDVLLQLIFIFSALQTAF